MPERINDLNGREVRAGDLIRVFHYIDRKTKRKVYMYRMVETVGNRLYAKTLPARCPCKCLLSALMEDFEIIDGDHGETKDGFLECWYDRPRIAELEKRCHHG